MRRVGGEEVGLGVGEGAEHNVDCCRTEVGFVRGDDHEAVKTNEAMPWDCGSGVHLRLPPYVGSRGQGWGQLCCR